MIIRIPDDQARAGEVPTRLSLGGGRVLKAHTCCATGTRFLAVEEGWHVRGVPSVTFKDDIATQAFFRAIWVALTRPPHCLPNAADVLTQRLSECVEFGTGGHVIALDLAAVARAWAYCQRFIDPQEDDPC